MAVREDPGRGSLGLSVLSPAGEDLVAELRFHMAALCGRVEELERENESLLFQLSRCRCSKMLDIVYHHQFVFVFHRQAIRALREVCTRNHSRKITRQATELSRGSRKHIPSFGSLLHYRKLNRHANGRKLDTAMFESYLEDLWSKISQKKRSSYTYIDCLWFCIYKYELAKTKVLQWIKSKQIFSRKYVFVPIICWRHWSLLILCHFGESGKSKQKKPIMPLLDSFHKIDPKRLELDIRRNSSSHS